MQKNKEKFIKDIYKIFEKKPDLEKLDEAIEIDSLIALNLIVYFEDKLKINLQTKDIKNFKSFNDILKKSGF
jgi:acyl carrier protein